MERSDELKQLVTILQSEIEIWDEKRKSKYVSREQKAIAHGRWAEATFILEQITYLKK